MGGARALLLNDSAFQSLSEGRRASSKSILHSTQVPEAWMLSRQADETHDQWKTAHFKPRMNSERRVAMTSWVAAAGCQSSP